LQVPVWFGIVGLLDRVLPDLSKDTNKSSMWRNGAIKTFLYFGIWMVLPVAKWMIASAENADMIKDWAISNALVGFTNCAFVGVIGRNHRVTIDIQTVEALGISPRKAIGGAGWGFLGGLCVYLIYLLMVPPDCFPWFWQDPIELYSSIIYPIFGAMVGLCIGGIVPRIDNTKTLPNQGIRLSWYNALIASGGTGLLCSTVGCGLLMLMPVLTERQYSFSTCLFTGLALGLLVSFFVGLWFGGLAVIKHFLLRFQLAFTDQLPFQVRSFLERGVRLRLLRQVGGGCMFVHGLLREHFAGADSNTSQDLRQ